MLTVTAGPFSFKGVLETEKAPKTVAAFERLLPFHSKIIHVRWSGESASIRSATSTSGSTASPRTPPATRPRARSCVPGRPERDRLPVPYGGTMFASIWSVSSRATTS